MKILVDKIPEKAADCPFAAFAASRLQDIHLCKLSHKLCEVETGECPYFAEK